MTPEDFNKPEYTLLSIDNDLFRYGYFSREDAGKYFMAFSHAPVKEYVIKKENIIRREHDRLVFIGHIAYGGSTLIANIFNFYSKCVTYKEPSIMFNAFREPIIYEQYCKRYSDNSRNIIKLNPSTTFSINYLLEYNDNNRALLIYQPYEDFVASAIKPSRRDSAWKLMRDINNINSQIDFSTLCEIHWTNQMKQFEWLSNREDVRTLDTRLFFNDPLEYSRKIRDWFELEIDDKILDGRVKQCLMKHSKLGDIYSVETRINDLKMHKAQISDYLNNINIPEYDMKNPL